jgi:hypothetical protein
MQWKKKKIAERDAGLASQQAERAKNDRMRYTLSLSLSHLSYLKGTSYHLEKSHVICKFCVIC